MKSMRKFLAGLLTAAIIMTGVPVQAGAVNESFPGFSQGETAQESSEAGEGISENSAGDSQEKATTEDTAGDSQEKNTTQNDSGDNRESTTGETGGDGQSEKAPEEAAGSDSQAKAPENTETESGDTESTEELSGTEGQGELTEETQELAAPAGTFAIQNAASGKYVKTYSASDTPLTVNGEASDADILFKG